MTGLASVVSNVTLAGLIALVAWFVQHRLRQISLARVLWVLVLVKLITPPLVSVPLFSSARTACELGVCGCPQHATVGWYSSGACLWMVLGLWGCGAGVAAWNLARHWIRLERLLEHALPASDELQTLANRLADEISLRNPPRVVVVPGRLPPLVVPGWRGPRLVLPAGLPERLDDLERSALLLHELWHIKRRDHLVRLVESLVSIVYWWLPVGRLLGRELRACEEACCDAAVVSRLPQSRRAYAKLLLEVLDFSASPKSPVAPQATAMSAASDLELRLRTILELTPAPRKNWPVAMVTLLVAAVILPCSLRYDRVLLPAATQTKASDELTSASKVDDPAISLFCCPS